MSTGSIFIRRIIIATKISSHNKAGFESASKRSGSGRLAVVSFFYIRPHIIAVKIGKNRLWLPTLRWGLPPPLLSGVEGLRDYCMWCDFTPPPFFRWFSKCVFVRLRKGDEYIKSCLVAKPPDNSGKQLETLYSNSRTLSSLASWKSSFSIRKSPMTTWNKSLFLSPEPWRLVFPGIKVYVVHQPLEIAKSSCRLLKNFPNHSVKFIKCQCDNKLRKTIRYRYSFLFCQKYITIHIFSWCSCQLSINFLNILF